MRLIDADAFKEYIRNAYEQVKHMYPDGGEWARQITEDFCKDIDEQPTAEPKPEWIPCSKRLPELYKPVLVTGGDIIWICELIESPDLDDGEFQWEDKMLGHWYSFDNWDAWMPLPEPWGGDSDEGN